MAVAAAGCSQAPVSGPEKKRAKQAVEKKNPGSGNQSFEKQPGEDNNAGQDRQGEESTIDHKERGRVLAAHLLGRLRVSAEVERGYDRDLFYHWKDLGSCDVREIVLARQDRRQGQCGSDSGRWVSAYDGVTTTDPGAFDVDHMVPLAEAWASGARRWPEARRDAFANDLAPYSLIAVSASSNRSKSDQDPAEWMPENRSFACSYVARWIAVKFRWRLSVDKGELAFLREAVSDCGRRSLKLKFQVERFP